MRDLREELLFGRKEYLYAQAALDWPDIKPYFSSETNNLLDSFAKLDWFHQYPDVSQAIAGNLDTKNENFSLEEELPRWKHGFDNSLVWYPDHGTPLRGSRFVAFMCDFSMSEGIWERFNRDFESKFSISPPIWVWHLFYGVIRYPYFKFGKLVSSRFFVNVGKILLNGGLPKDTVLNKKTGEVHVYQYYDGEVELFQLIETSKSSNLPKIQSLLDQNPSLTQATKKGRSPLHVAAATCNSDFLGDLIEAGWFELDAKAGNGGSPLSHAVLTNHRGNVSTLLHYGANANFEDHAGVTALHDACEFCLEDTDIVELLLKYGADLYHRNRAGKRPIDLLDEASAKKLAIDVKGSSQSDQKIQKEVLASLEEIVASFGDDQKILSDDYEFALFVIWVCGRFTWQASGVRLPEYIVSFLASSGCLPKEDIETLATAAFDSIPPDGMTVLFPLFSSGVKKENIFQQPNHTLLKSYWVIKGELSDLFVRKYTYYRENQDERYLSRDQLEKLNEK